MAHPDAAVMCTPQIMLPGAMGPLLLGISWSILLSCSLGLFFLYKTTTADPGYIPTGCVRGCVWFNAVPCLSSRLA
jgi:hypothetical protein